MRQKLIIPIIFFLIGLICLLLIPYQTVEKAGRASFLINVNPRTFPYIMSLIMMGIGLINIISVFIRSKMKRADGEKEIENLNLKASMPLFLIMMIYVLLLSKLGYIVSTIGLTIATSIYFNAKPRQVVLLGLLLSPVIYYIFTKIGVPLPRGILNF